MSLVGIDRVAEAMNVSTRRVQQLVSEGMPKAARGRYDVGVCLRWYVRYLQGAIERRESASGKAGGDNVRKQRARLLQAQAEDAELELARKRGELVPVELLAQQMSNMIATARQNLLTLPTRLAPKIAGESNQVMIRETLRTHVRTSISALAMPAPYSEPFGACPECGQSKPMPVSRGTDDAQPTA